MSPGRLDPAGLDAVAVLVVVVVVVVVDVDVDVDGAVDGDLELAVAVEALSLVVEAEPDDPPAGAVDDPPAGAVDEPPAGAVDEPSDVEVASPVLELPTEFDAVEAGVGWPAVPEPVVPHDVAAARRTQRLVHERRCIAHFIMPCRSVAWRDLTLGRSAFALPRPPPRAHFVNAERAAVFFES
jgi:hypothetical protein